MSALLDRLRSARILAILRVDDVAGAGVSLARRLHSEGVRAIECTLDKPDALAAIEILRAELGSDTLIGAGTVTRIDQVDALVEIGAEFCVTPHLDPDLVTHSLDRGLPILPGVMTPSEVATALRLGAPAVKLFPAGILGLDYLRALQGPFGRFPVIPTGNLAVGDVVDWIEAGAICVGLGSTLTRGDHVPAGLRHLLNR